MHLSNIMEHWNKSDLKLCKNEHFLQFFTLYTVCKRIFFFQKKKIILNASNVQQAFSFPEEEIKLNAISCMKQMYVHYHKSNRRQNILVFWQYSGLGQFLKNQVLGLNFPITGYLLHCGHSSVFRNTKFMLDEMTQQNASKFAIFWSTKTQVDFFPL